MKADEARLRAARWLVRECATWYRRATDDVFAHRWGNTAGELRDARHWLVLVLRRVRARKEEG